METQVGHEEGAAAARAIGRSVRDALRLEDSGRRTSSEVRALFDAQVAESVDGPGARRGDEPARSVHHLARQARALLGSRRRPAEKARAFAALASHAGYAPSFWPVVWGEVVQIAAVLLGSHSESVDEDDLVRLVSEGDRLEGELMDPHVTDALSRLRERLRLRAIKSQVAQELVRPPRAHRRAAHDGLVEDLRGERSTRSPGYRGLRWSDGVDRAVRAGGETERVVFPPPAARLRKMTGTPARPAARAVVNLQVVVRGAGPREATPPQLEVGRRYWLRMSVGPREAAAAAGAPRAIRSQVLEARELSVHVFPDTALGAPAFLGRLEVTPGRAATVLEAAQVPPQRLVDRRHLHWSFETPTEPGAWRLRCLLLVHGTVVHVEQLDVVVGTSRRRLRQTTTFRLMRDLGRISTADRLTAPTLALYANHADDHGSDFSFLPVAADAAASSAASAQVALSADLVQGLLRSGRSALAQASWGRPEAYVDGWGAVNGWRGTRFEPSTTAAQLIGLARAGRQMWQAFTQAISQDPDAIDALEAQMRPRGVVALAVRKNPRHVVPIQLVYDRPLDLTLPPASLTLCESSAAWLARPVGEPPCLDLPCATDGDRSRVCLGGFWGFRHGISVTLSSLAPSAGAVLNRIENGQPLSSVVTVATDPEVRQWWPPHEAALDDWLDLSAPQGTTPAEVLAALVSQQPSIAYFLTHVEVTRDAEPVPFLKVGSGGIDATALMDARVRMGGSRPLVFLNGCASAALTPERLLGLIDRFLAHGASSAVGTEVTVFTDLAVRFAEAFFARFCAGVPLAEAMRAARVAVLALGNPLGLAYSAYGVHDLRLAQPVRQ